MHTVLETKPYSAKVASLFTDEEKADIATLIALRPDAGDVVPGTGGVRKVRIAMSGRGKSGGARVIYYWHDERWPIYLLDVFAKGTKSNLTMAERNALAAVTRELKAHFRSMER